MNLVCSSAIRELLDVVQEELMNIANQRFEGNKVELGTEYIAKRGALLDAIREDIDLFQAN